MQWISNESIDRQKWDACIDRCAWGKVYALSWYLDLLTGNDWEALVYGDYDYVMPVPYRKKFGISYTYRPNFCQQLGVFSSHNEIPERLFKAFIRALFSKYKHIHYPLNHANVVPEEFSFYVKKRTNLILKLDRDYESQSNNYSTNLKSNLKKAEKAGLRVVRNIESGLVISLYKAAWQSLHKIRETDYLNFQKIIEHGKKLEMAIGLGVYKNDILLASCFILRFKNRIYYPFSAISQEGRKYGATAFLIDRIIQENSDSGYYLDFEGSDIASVQYFYKKFNPETEYYRQFEKPLTMVKRLFSLNFLR